MNRQEFVRNFVLNLEKERIALGFTQGQMAEKLEMSLSGYKKLVSGETTRVDAYLVHLLYQLTHKWLFEFIEEDMEQGPILRNFRELTPAQLKFVASVAQFEADFHEQNPENVDDYITVLVLTGDFGDGMIYDSTNIIKVNAAAYRKKFGADLNCGIKVTSNHLHPVYNMDDILLICRRPIRDGDTGIFINKRTGRAYVRKYRQTNPVRLEPVNELGETFLVDPHDREDMDQWIKFGYVLCKMRAEEA